jgi:hypothetical protein
MVHKLAIAISLSLLVWLPAVAQEPTEEHIETDRDSFTPSTATVEQGRLMLEAGYSFVDNRNSAETHSFPELLARYGLNDWLELRLGSNYEVGGESSGVTGGGGGELDGTGVESEAKVTYGLKTKFTNQDGWLPQSAAILQASTPTSGPETDTHLLATYAWGWLIDDIWLWDSAIRYGDASEEEDQFNRWAPSTVVKVDFTEQWSVHLEYFGIFTEGREDEASQSYLSPGIHYLVTPNFEVGLRLGWGLSDDAANFFSNFGIGLLF